MRTAAVATQKRRSALDLPLPAAFGRAEQGSAYIIALLALVVLTILGLSLSVITQSELVIGANERVEKRAFYAADAGIDLTLARALVNGDYEAADLEIPDPGSKLPGVTFEISMSPLFPIAYPPCNLCEINNRGNYANDRSYSAVDFAATSVATRSGSLGGALARKTISSMLEVQPVQLTTDALVSVGDEEQLQRLKF